MAKTLVLVHTVPPLLPVFSKLGAELLPGVRLMHILDEPLLERVRQRGRLTTADSARLQEHIAMAQEVGAAAVLVTCSTISPCVDDIRPQAVIPVLKIDEAMIAQAVERGEKIGVVATAPTTLEPTRQALEAQAARLGRLVETRLILVEHAMSALLTGDGETHDRLVKAAVLGLAPQVDVVVLAQASMARVLEIMPQAERPLPILSSPHLALEALRHLLSPNAYQRRT